MLKRCSIRYKLLIGTVILFVIVTTLSFSGIRSIYSYRRLVRSVSNRAAEMPLADNLIRSVNDLRVTFSQLGQLREPGDSTEYAPPIEGREKFRWEFGHVKDALQRYRQQLQLAEVNGSGIGDNSDEQKKVREIQQVMERMDRFNNQLDWVLNNVQVDVLGEDLDLLYQLANDLPGHLRTRMQELKGNVRGQYHTLIGLTWATSILSGVMLMVLVKLLYDWVFGPLRMLIHGSRRVAAGDFDHRIKLDTHDEMAELAGAMNDMTARFQEIRDDLDRQVKQRTKEIVRSEQLASVGFLAAGVSHEINNPLASIAWCAESLESRLHDIIYVDDAMPDENHNPEIGVLRTYLRRIQDEAFRCKGITERLLDFSRMGDVEKYSTDLRELTQDVIDMVKHLGRYRNKRIQFKCDDHVVASVNAQEIKQVVLNLVTNALDSLDSDGLVEIELHTRGGQAQLVVSDNGCGMTDEVLEHLFEPFFTRRRDGQGTGLGLSISYRIVVDHGGEIEASSKGPGQGSQIQITLPLAHHEEKRKIQKQAA